ncbi:uncharacterized protein LOC127850805 [Dreissena polymorpha]|uniref:uncharacterized protein LOC127850805 n=1 Tax=Dreissena polymorpha TaxID=45954 RepID=UPI002264FF22|nr:uncharacterized protein LOC127850805 [Dreissena polymorpha]XP_052240087.1 uncharacterized protein LOC127850805 [Dreissena polymorpha]
MGLKSFKTLLVDAVPESAFLVTCGVLSHAIFKNNQTYELFDSHGYITKYNGRKIKRKGSIFSFSSVDELNQFVLAVHGEGAYVQVAQVTVKLPEAKRLSKVFHEHGYEPYIDNNPLPAGEDFPAILDDSSIVADEDSGYIAMIGSRD